MQCAGAASGDASHRDPWPQLVIGPHRPRYPIIQGGMAIRLSTSRLAAAVAAAGCIGVIAGTGMSEEELRREIRAARRQTDGIIGVNIMYAARQFADIVRWAMSEGIDLLISGAGFSRDMFTWGREYGVPVVPIVGTAKLAKMSEDLGAAAVVVEGVEAGGHLGTDRSVLDLMPEIRAAVKLPVIAAGGIVDAADMARVFDLGADGVQIGIRFGATVEANGHDRLKEYYLKSRREDVILIQSPVGLPGRALRNEFSDAIAAGTLPPVEDCTACLKRCSRAFCIREALCRAQAGDVVTGLIFSGAEIERICDIKTAAEVVEDLIAGLRALRAPVSETSAGSVVAGPAAAAGSGSGNEPPAHSVEEERA